jgi:MFS family permease
MPVLPYKIFDLGGKGSDIGVVSACYQFAAIFALPATAKLSDKYGRRPFFLTGFIGSLVGFLVIAFSTKVWMIIAGRFIGGLFGASMPIAQAYISDVVGTAGKESGRLRAQLGSVFMAALIFAPGFGGGLAEFSLETPFFVSAGLAMLGFILGYFYITEPERNDEKKKNDDAVETIEEEPLSPEDVQVKDKKEEEADAAEYARNAPTIRVLWAAIFFSNLGFRSMIVMLAIWVNYKFGWSTKEFGFMASAVGIVGIGSNMILYGKMSDRYGTVATCCVSGFISMLFWIVTAFSRQTVNGGEGNFWTGPFLYLAATVIRTCFNSIFTTSSKTLLAKYATKKTQGTVMGSSESLNAIAGVIGPVIAGVIYDNEGQDYLPLVSAACYLVSFALILSVYFKERRESSANTKEDEEAEPLMVEFDTVKGELIFLRSRVHELEMEVATLKGSSSKSGAAPGARERRPSGIELMARRHADESSRHMMA